MSRFKLSQSFKSVPPTFYSSKAKIWGKYIAWAVPKCHRLKCPTFCTRSPKTPNLGQHTLQFSTPINTQKVQDPNFATHITISTIPQTMQHRNKYHHLVVCHHHQWRNRSNLKRLSLLKILENNGMKYTTMAQIIDVSFKQTSIIWWSDI